MCSVVFNNVDKSCLLWRLSCSCQVSDVQSFSPHTKKTKTPAGTGPLACTPSPFSQTVTAVLSFRCHRLHDAGGHSETHTHSLLKPLCLFIVNSRRDAIVTDENTELWAEVTQAVSWIPNTHSLPFPGTAERIYSKWATGDFQPGNPRHSQM